MSFFTKWLPKKIPQLPSKKVDKQKFYKKREKYLWLPKTDPATAGLKRFFGNPKDSHLLPVGFKIWSDAELSCKSKDEVICLWYEILREKNMLRTMQHESFRQKTGFYTAYQDKVDKLDQSLNAVSAHLKKRTDLKDISNSN